MKLIIDIPKSFYKKCLDRKEQMASMFLEENAIANGIPLDNENITNGEMLKIIFPNIITDELAITMHTVTKVTCCGDKHCKGAISYDFWKEWWNAPYKENYIEYKKEK